MQDINQLENYQIIKKVGQGAFATVYLGYNDEKQQYTAVKQISKSRLTQEQLQNIDREIAVLLQFENQNIIKFLESRSTKEYVYLILEYCSLGDLDKVLYETSSFKKEGFPEKLAQMFVQQIQYALIDMQSKGIIHRDLKLSNLLLSQDLQVKVADFGFAKYQDRDKCLQQSHAGTPLTMAPEVLLDMDYNQQCDIWSIGVIIYQMVYGVYPLQPPEGKGYATLVRMMQELENKSIQFPNNKEVSPELKDLLSKMLVFNPQKRINLHGVLDHPWLQQQLDTNQIKELYKSQLVQNYEPIDIQFEVYVGTMLQKIIEENVQQFVNNIKAFVLSYQDIKDQKHLKEINNDLHIFLNELQSTYTFEILGQKYPLHKKAKIMIQQLQNFIPFQEDEYNNQDPQLKNQTGIYGIPLSLKKTLLSLMSSKYEKNNNNNNNNNYFFQNQNNNNHQYTKRTKQFCLDLCSLLLKSQENFGIIKSLQVQGKHGKRINQIDLYGIYLYDKGNDQNENMLEDDSVVYSVYQQQDQQKSQYQQQDQQFIEEDFVDDSNVIDIEGGQQNGFDLEKKISSMQFDLQKNGFQNNYDIKFVIEETFFPFLNQDDMANLNLLYAISNQ